jgi:hypothetical protein
VTFLKVSVKNFISPLRATSNSRQFMSALSVMMMSAKFQERGVFSLQRADAVLHGGALVVFARLAADGDVGLLDGQRILERLDDIHEIRRAGTIQMLLSLERAIRALMMRPPRPWPHRGRVPGDESQRRLFQPDGKLFFGSVAEFELVFDC